MSAAATVLQMVRAHYRCDEAAFKSAAETMARNAKTPRVRESIFDAVRSGSSFVRKPHHQPTAPKPMSPLPPTNSDGMLQALKPVTFAGLMLEEHLQLALDEIVIELEYREHLAERNLRPRSRLLLHGPLGNGKTSSGAAIANALDVRAFGVHLPEVLSSFIGGTGKNLGSIFSSLGPSTLVVFDELDAIGSGRSGANSAGGKEYNTIVNTLLTLLDRHDTGIIIATTNRPDIIDPALRRRFDEEIYFPEPTVPQMRNLAERISLEHDVGMPDVDDCRNFDEVTKRCLTHARRIVMQQILAAERGEEPQSQEEQPNGRKEEELH